MAFLIVILLLLGVTAGAMGMALLRESGDVTVQGVARLRALLGLTTMADLQRQAVTEVLRRSLASVSVRYLPNDVLVLLHPDDAAKVGDLAAEFTYGVETLLQSAVRNGDRDSGLPYQIVGGVDVRLKSDGRVAKGTVGVVASVSKDTQLIGSAVGAGLLDLRVGDQLFPLPMHGDVVVGRGEAADVRIQRPDVSREHVLLECQGMHVILRQTSDTNRTRVNGEAVLRADLNLGDRVELGATLASIELSSHAASLVARDTDPLPT